MATLFVDYENGDNNYAGTSFNVLASGTNGRISSQTFSSATANFPNNGTLCNINNILGASERLFDTSAWFASSTTLTRVGVTPPSGINGNVHSLIENTVSTVHFCNTNSSTYATTIGTQYTSSVYVKANGRNQVVFRFDSSGSTLGVRYNLASGTVAQSGAGATGTITSIGDGWYRLTLTATATNTSQSISIGIGPDSSNTTDMPNYTGDGTSGIYIAAPQIQTGNTATTYEKSPTQYLSIFNGSLFAVFEIMQYLSNTSLFIKAISGGTGLSNQTVDRQYYIGGRWRTLTDGATAVRMMEGDTVRIMGSPAPTSIGSATWASEKTPTSIAITSSTNSSPITINCASTMSSLGISTGDTVNIAGHTTNTNANGTWEVTVSSPSATSFTLNGSTGNGVGGATGRFRKKTNSVIRLPSALTANIASYGNRGEGRTAWVASSNVTATLLDTDTKEGDVSDSIAIGAAFTTGKAAYKATGSLNLSGYQQISFWIKQTAGTASVNGDISLRLCSDTTGDTTVHTFNIDGLLSLNNWTCIVINLGTNMSNSIQSVALYVDADKGAQTFLLSNIIACKASSSDDSLNLCSLIGKNTTDEPWWPLMSINGTRVMLGCSANTTPLTGALTGNLNSTERGYYGTSETVTTFKRETINVLRASGENHNALQVGTISNRTKYAFGWDRTNMSAQNLETYLDGRNGATLGFNANGLSNIDINRVGAVRFTTGIIFGNGINSTGDFEWVVGCTNGFNILVLWRSTIDSVLAAANGTGGTPISLTTSNYYLNINKMIAISNIVNASGISYALGHQVYTTNIKSINNGGHGISVSTGVLIFVGGTIEANADSGFTINSGTNVKLKNINILNNTTYGVYPIAYSEVICENCLINQSTEAFVNSYSNFRVHFIDHDNVVGNNFTFIDNGLIVPQASVRYSNSGYAWALSPTSSTIRTSTNPLDLKVATVVVEANSPVTVRAWVRRSSTALTMGLRIKGDQIAGVPSDITSYMTAAANTWQQISLTFTPTEVGVVEIVAECFGGTTNTGYVDDISITQG